MTAQLQPHQQRVVDEHAECLERLRKLRAFIANTDGPFQTLCDEEQRRLVHQEDVMNELGIVLAERVAAFTPGLVVLGARCTPSWPTADPRNYPGITQTSHPTRWLFRVWSIHPPCPVSPEHTQPAHSSLKPPAVKRRATRNPVKGGIPVAGGRCGPGQVPGLPHPNALNPCGHGDMWWDRHDHNSTNRVSPTARARRRDDP